MITHFIKHFYSLYFKSLLMFLVISGFEINAQTLTLKDAYNLMLQKNGEIKASSFEVNEKKEENEAVKGLRYPTVGVSAIYLHLNNDINLDLNSTRNTVGGLLNIPNPAAVLGDWNYTLQEKNLGFATAEISMPLFAGGKINQATKVTKIKVGLAENSHQIKEDELTIKLIDYYFKLKLALEVEKVRKQVYKTILLHYNQAIKFFKNGLIPEVETLNAQVALTNAETDLKGSIKDVDLAKTALENTIGINQIDSIPTNFTKPTVLKSLREFQTDMLAENAQLKVLEKNYNLAKLGVKIEQSDYFPKIGVFGNYIPWTDNLPLIEDTKWFVGVGAKWDLFNGFQREHKIKAAKFKINQVEELDKQVKLNLTIYTEKLYNTSQKEIEQYESLAVNEAYAQKLKYMRTRAFEEGTGTSLEVIDATLKLSLVQLNKIQALYEYNLAYGELMVLTGKTVSFLNQN